MRKGKNRRPQNDDTVADKAAGSDSVQGTGTASVRNGSESDIGGRIAYGQMASFTSDSAPLFALIPRDLSGSMWAQFGASTKSCSFQVLAPKTGKPPARPTWWLSSVCFGQSGY